MYTDREWVDRLKGPPDQRDIAIRELSDLLSRGLARGLGSYLDGASYVDDMTQEALLKIIASIEQFEGKSRFLTWAMTIATRVGISFLRRKHHRDQSMDAFADDGGYQIDLNASPSAEVSVTKAELFETLQRLINEELTEKQRMVLCASLDGYSTDGIAERANLSRNSVYKFLHDARIKLKDGLLKSGFDSDDVPLVTG